MPIIKRCVVCKKKIDKTGNESRLCKEHATHYGSNRKNKLLDYGGKWKKISLEFKAYYPFCVLCYMKDSRIKMAEITDHIYPLSDDMSKHPFKFNPNHPDALAPLCRKHHAAKTHIVDKAYFSGNMEPMKGYIDLVETAKIWMREGVLK